MFQTLFGSKSAVDTKTIELLYDEIIDQEVWTHILIDIDLKISSYYDYSDIITISAPYSIIDIKQSIDIIFNKINLICISPLVIQFLFGDRRDIESKLKFVPSINMSKVEELIENTSIIIIDIKSSEMFKLPRFATNLSTVNIEINDHKSYNDDESNSYWKMRWSVDDMVTSCNFQNILTDICQQFEDNNNVSQFFKIYTGHPPQSKMSWQKCLSKLHSAIEQIEIKEADIEQKMDASLQRAKEKSKIRDKKGALFELKKYKQLKYSLEGLRGKKLGIETQESVLREAFHSKFDK